MSPLDVALLAASLAAATGLAHGLSLLARHHLWLTFTWHSRDALWMSPLGYLLFLAVPAVPLAIASAFRWRIAGWRTAVVLLGWLAFTGAGLLLKGIHWLAILVVALGIAVRLASAVAGNQDVWRQRIRRAAAILWGGVVVAAGGERLLRDEAPLAALPQADPPNVLLLILDTVRASNLGLYGYTRPTSPALDRFAEEGVVFEHAMATAPWTLPSHATMFTGVHGGRLSTSWRRPFDGSVPTLAERFHAAGYATGGFVGNLFYTHHESGLDRGFQTWKDFDISLTQIIWSTTLGQTPTVNALMWARTPHAILTALRNVDLTVPSEPANDRRTASEVVENFLEWQRGVGARPFLAFVNLFDAHDPYEPPPAFDQRFGPKTDAEAQYDASIAYIDQVVDSLFATLRSRGVLDRTLVIVTSDHGEQFGEHGLRNHGNSLYLPVLHVPLVMRYPPRLPGGSRVRPIVSLRDLAATIVDVAGVGGTFPGTSLMALCCDTTAQRLPWDVIAETEQVESRNTRAPAAHGDLATMFTDSLQFIRNGDGSFELYRWRVDPETNLALDLTWCTEARRLDDRLRAVAARPPTPPFRAAGCDVTPVTLPTTGEWRPKLHQAGTP